MFSLALLDHRYSKVGVVMIMKLSIQKGITVLPTTMIFMNWLETNYQWDIILRSLFWWLIFYFPLVQVRIYIRNPHPDAA